ncbi:hypothetical protein ACS0TY_010687 [Phlomoides rotata]
MVTDNASNYKAAGKLLHAKYPGIYWSPCSAHVINLTLEDVGKMDLVKECVILGSRITTFVYNHKWPLAWLRQMDGWTEIVTPGATRFGTNFIALKSLYDHKEHLEALVICPDYKKFLKTEKGRGVKDTVFNQRFWNNCLIVVKIMEPLMRLLRICDTDEKPSLGYVYEGLSRAIRGTKEIFNNQESKYKPFVDIINKRWDKMLRKRLHAAAYWLNPAFQYDPNSSLHNEPEAYKGLLGIIQDLHPDTPGIMQEVTMFREGKKCFGIPLAKKEAKTTTPGTFHYILHCSYEFIFDSVYIKFVHMMIDEWWRLFGVDAPHLQNLAIRILSQTSSSSGCEHNWSVFERIHTKKRNRLEHERLSDLVFVHYNLRLKNREKQMHKTYDPIDYECIDKVDAWIIDDAPNGELDYDELEELDNELANNELPESQGGNENVDKDILNDHIDLTKFGLGSMGSSSSGVNLDVFSD